MGKGKAQKNKLKRASIIAIQTPLWASIAVIKDIYALARDLTILAAYGYVFCVNSGKALRYGPKDNKGERDLINFTVDHEIPLRGEDISGLHAETNMQIMPDHINNEKGNAYPWDIRNYKGSSFRGAVEVSGVVMKLHGPEFLENLPYYREITSELLRMLGHETGVGMSALPAFEDSFGTDFLHFQVQGIHGPIIWLSDMSESIVSAFTSCGEGLVRNVSAGIREMGADMASSFGEAMHAMLGSVQPVIEAVAPTVEFVVNIAMHLL